MVAVVAAIASGRGRSGSWGGWFVVAAVGVRVGGGGGMGTLVGRGIVDCGELGGWESLGKGTWIKWSLAVQSNGT